MELLKRAIITKWQKVSKRFIDSSFNEWCRGLECVNKMTVDMSNTAISVE